MKNKISIMGGLNFNPSFLLHYVKTTNILRLNPPQYYSLLI